MSFYELLDCTSYVRSNESIQGEEDAKKNEQLKQAIAQKINEVGDLNKEFNIQESDVTDPDESEYSDVFSAIQSNTNDVFKKSLIAFNNARRYAKDETVRRQNVEKLNAAIKKEYPMFLLQQSDLGKKILPLLGSDYTWNGIDDLVSKCLENEQIVNLLMPKEQQEEDAWIENKLNHFRQQGIL